MASGDKNRRTYIGSVGLAFLLGLSLGLDVPDATLTGAASGGRGGCGGEGGETHPGLCVADSDCMAPEFCQNDACVEPTLSNSCFRATDFEETAHSSENPGRSLSYLWSEAKGALTLDERSEAEELLNSIYLLFVEEFGFPVISAPVRFRVFSDSDTYNRCMLVMDRPEGGSPAYSRSHDTIFFLKSSQSWELTLRILLHEGVHFIFRHAGVRPGSTVFNEGTAVFMSTISKEQRGGQEVLVISPHQARYEPMLVGLREHNRLLNMETLLGFSNAEWQQNSGVAYAQSYSIIYFLMELHRSDMRDIFSGLLSGGPPAVGNKELIEEAYGSSSGDAFEQFVLDWEAWLEMEHQSITFNP